MNLFDELLERDLRHIADRATPSSTAWEAIQTRAAEQVDHPELEITMLKPNPKPDHRVRTWMISAAAAVLLIAGGIYVALSGDDSPSRVTETDTVDTPEPTTAPTTTPPTTAPTTTAPTPTTAPPPEVSADALATIEEFLGSADMATLNTVVTEAAIAASPGLVIAADANEWLVGRQVLGVEVGLLSCLEAGSETNIRCQVSIRSAITEAFGQEPRLRGVTFEFTDGLISNWPTVVAGSDFDETRDATIAAGLGDELDAACQQKLTLDCAGFLMANLDAIAAAAG